MNRIRMIVDTDIGSDVDDALALLLLLHLPNVEVLGVTTVYGPVDVRAKIASKIIRARGLSIPVIAGCESPLSRKPPMWVSGIEGQGILHEEETAAPLSEFGIAECAEDFIIDTVAAYPGEITILALGPLTNIARALEKEPSLAEKIGATCFMGGGVTYPRPVPCGMEEGARCHAVPSHNVWCDLNAARRVFQSALPIKVVTNDVTTRIWWDGPTMVEMMDSSLPETRMVGQLMRVHLEQRSRLQRETVTGTCPHDVLAAAEASGTPFVRYIEGTMEIMCDRATEFTVQADGRHSAGIEVDVDAFIGWFTPRLLKRTEC